MGGDRQIEVKIEAPGKFRGGLCLEYKSFNTLFSDNIDSVALYPISLGLQFCRRTGIGP